jgi:error-prone DNA polymerase
LLLAALPAPLGSLPELLRPPTLGGAGAPSAELAPAEPTPALPPLWHRAAEVEVVLEVVAAEQVTDLGHRGQQGSSVRTARDGLPITISGLVMLRQRPGSAKGVMFITLEDETDTAKLIVWPSLFEQQRRVIMGASMMACRGKVQSANGVIHVIAGQLIDQSELLAAIGGLDEAFAVPTGRGDEAFTAAGPVSMHATRRR